MKKIPLAISIFMLTSIFGAAAYSSGPGTTSANFLKFGAGARPLGMGGAFAAVADDLNSLYWNPAGLAECKTPQLSLMHNEIGEGLRLEAAKISVPVKRFKGVLAGGFTYFSVNDIQGYNAGGTKTSLLSASDSEFTAGYGTALQSHINAGVSLKAVSERLSDYSSTAYAVDAGVLCKFDHLSSPFLSKMRLALAGRNFGTGMKFIEESYKLPENMTVAAAYDGLLISNRFLIAVDYNIPSDNDAYFNIGTEYFINELIALRCGYQTNDDLAGGLRAGVGLRVRNIDLDYAFIPRGDLGASHRIGFTLRFGTRYDELLVYRRIEAQFEKGLRYYNSGDLVRAHREFRNVVLVAPGHEKAKEYLARSEMRIDEMQEKNSMEIHMALGEKYFHEDRLGDAQAEFDSVLEVSPGNEKAVNYAFRIKSAIQSMAEALFSRGVKQYHGGEYEKTIESMNKVLAIDPEHLRAKEYIGLAGGKIKKIKELQKTAVESENKARKERYSNTALEEGLADYDQKKWRNAVRKFRDSLSLNADNVRAKQYLDMAGAKAAEEYVQAGKKAYAAGDLAEAEKQLNTAVSYDPGNEESSKTLLEIRQRLARDRKDKAFELNKEALAAYASQDNERAAKLWRKALELDPDLEEAKKSLDRVDNGTFK